MNTEIWKDVKGYEGLYQASFCGAIKSLKRNRKGIGGAECSVRERILSQSLDGNRYACVALSKGGKRKTMKVHRLVAIAFIENPEDKPQVNHIDGVKTNNNISNLEWATAAENSIHSVDVLHNNWGAQKSKNFLGKGVALDKRDNRYTVRLQENGKQRYFGRYKNLKEAQEKANAEHLRVHGILPVYAEKIRNASSY